MSTATTDPDAFAYDVFISYSHADAAWVHGELLPRLEGAGLTVCIDFRDFAIGAPTVTEIERAIRTSRRTLLVLTPAYLASQWTEFETLLLQTLDPPNQQRRLIPLLREPCDLPLRIRFLTYLPMSDPSSASQAWPRLLQALTPTTRPKPSTPTPPPSPRPMTNDQVTILFVAADPSDAARLRIGAEFRELDEKLRLGRQRDRLHLHLPQLSARPADLSQALLDYAPQLVHFSGHGAADGSLLFENATGQSQAVAPEALAALFAHFAGQINCVLLNGCFTAAQATLLRQHIRFVIGTSNQITDAAAIAFAVGFYQALAAGKAIPEAFALGRIQIGLQGLPGSDLPVLVARDS